jgi:hypothetical protein
MESSSVSAQGERETYSVDQAARILGIGRSRCYDAVKKMRYQRSRATWQPHVPRGVRLSTFPMASPQKRKASVGRRMARLFAGANATGEIKPNGKREAVSFAAHEPVT